MNVIGPEELRHLPFLAGERMSAPEIPFSRNILDDRASTHILIFTPSIPWLTLNGLREKLGTNPTQGEPCMYDQDWYIKEVFASNMLDGKWHFIQKEVVEKARGKQPEDIEQSLLGEQFPTAITAAFTFFAWRLLRNETLWSHDFLWCSDTDHNGDRIYVGRYEDPEGINKNGFNVHRHLSIRRRFSVAPEVLA